MKCVNDESEALPLSASVPASDYVIIGGTGDLSIRKIFPALFLFSSHILKRATIGKLKEYPIRWCVYLVIVREFIPGCSFVLPDYTLNTIQVPF